MLLPVIMVVNRDGLVCRERFASLLDAEYWRRLVLATLEVSRAKALDLGLYAAGLADAIRTHGGPFAPSLSLFEQANAQQLAEFMPIEVLQDLDRQIREVIRRKRGELTW